MRKEHWPETLEVSMVTYAIIEFEFLEFLVASEAIFGGRSVTREGVWGDVPPETTKASSLSSSSINNQGN